jgi:heme/copper-type cytochrome/quinol oxidase subunit 2
MRTPPSLRIVAAAFASLMAGGIPLRAQCAMCNAAGDASRAGRAFSISVLFLLGSLFLSIAGIVLLAARRARRRPEPDPGARGRGERAGGAAPDSPSPAA